MSEPRARRLLKVAAIGVGVVIGIGTVAVLALLVMALPPHPPDRGAFVALPLPPLPLSRVEIPVAYDLATLRSEVEVRTPARIGDMSARYVYGADPRFTYAYEAVRGPIDVQASGDTLRLSATIAYGGRAWYRPPAGPTMSAGCADGDGVPRARAGIEFVVTIGLDREWAPRPSVAVARVEPVADEDRCLLDFFAFQIDVTETIMNELRRALEVEARAIEASLREAPLQQMVRDTWASLGTPIPVAQGGWIVLDPEALDVQPLSTPPGSGAVNGRIVLTARPSWHADAPTTGVGGGEVSPPLPADADAMRVPRDAGVIEADLHVPLRTISSALADDLVGAEAMVLGRTVRVVGAAVRPADASGRVVFVVDLTGLVPGRVVVEGAPFVDVADDVIGLSGVTLRVEGGRTTEFLARVLRPILERSIERRARWSVVDLVRGATDAFAGSTRLPLVPGADLLVAVDDVAITGLATSDDALIVRGRVTPEALLEVRF